MGTCSVFAWQRDRACARRKAQEGEVFALCARGFRVFAFNARSGSIPLLPLGALLGEAAKGFLGLPLFQGFVVGGGLRWGRTCGHVFGVRLAAGPCLRSQEGAGG